MVRCGTTGESQILLEGSRMGVPVVQVTYVEFEFVIHIGIAHTHTIHYETQFKTDLYNRWVAINAISKR